ncbi:SWIM zinc finger family protein [Antarcticirhabdus aurantiaca]|uniref:SWIM zinc finger domain-containing protein n=1 Tax=Antarcticirhabdus aurantiaca TaxID=2606717 RepID=A0ACD4NTW7_9HYPH|nr:SWIM zinc finger family protein [Antarcticirhabdus aurantiaca]WAJ30346.1 SWIM zinc finger domain-containing protein [Jeongeuplla avenae]
MSGAPRFEPAGFGDDVLEAAASKGLVRRARRDVEAGLVAAPAWEDGTAVLSSDGETVRLPPGPLSGARCTCPAGGACRHILAAVIALREAPVAEDALEVEDAEADALPLQPLSPPADPLAEIRAIPPAALAKAFGRAAVVRAEGLLAALAPDDVRIEAEPGFARIRLGEHPEVMVPVGAGLSGLVSKADRRERAALHAAALLAVLRPDLVGAKTEDETQLAGNPSSVAANGLAEAVSALLRDAARQALSSAPAALEERIGDLVLSSRVEAMPRLAAELRALGASLRRRRERSDDEEPRMLLARIAQAYALAEALRLSPNDPALSGAGRDTPEPLPDGRFVGCGLELWRTGSGARGATAHVLRAEDGRPFTLTLARAAGTDPGFTRSRSATEEAVLGQTLARLAAADLTLAGAAADGRGRFSLRAGVATRQPGSWRAAIEAVPGAVFDDWGQLAARLGEALRPALAGAAERGRPFVLRPTALGPLSFDGVAQVGRLPVADAEGVFVELEIPGDERLEARVEALARARGAPTPPLLCVMARLRGDGIVLVPTAIGGDALQLLDLPADPYRRQPATSFFADWARRLDALAGRRTSEEPRFEPVPRPNGPRIRLAETAADELLALAELGGRMEDPERLARIERAANGLREIGLDTPARVLQRLAAAPRHERAHHLLVAAYALDTLSRLEPRLPFVQRV